MLKKIEYRCFEPETTMNYIVSHIGHIKNIRLNSKENVILRQYLWHPCSNNS